jgi:hypothetical protein
MELKKENIDPQIIKLKDEVTQLNFEIEKMWKILLNMQSKIGELENFIRTNLSKNLLQ